MKNEEITTKEYIYLIHSYTTISTFILLTLSKTTENLGKVLYFNPITSLLIVLNMIVFISFHIYKRKHTIIQK